MKFKNFLDEIVLEIHQTMTQVIRYLQLLPYLVGCFVG